MNILEKKYNDMLNEPNPAEKIILADELIDQNYRYYDVLIIKLEALKKENNINEFVAIILEELKMPFIPGDFKEKISDLLGEVNMEFDYGEYNNDMKILKIIDSDKLDDQLALISLFSKSKISDYYDEIKYKLLDSNFDDRLKILLIDLLYENDLRDPIEFLISEDEIVLVNVTEYYDKKNKIFSNGKKFIEEVNDVQMEKLFMEIIVLYIYTYFPDFKEYSDSKHLLNETVYELSRQLLNKDELKKHEYNEDLYHVMYDIIKEY